MHKIFNFVHLKFTFSILHTYFYKTPTSICLFYTFIQIKYSFLYPHSHRPTATNPHRYHTRIHTAHRKKTRKTNRNPHNPLAPGINTTQQHNPHNPAIRNRNKPSNTIHTTHPKLTPRLEQQDRRLRW